MDFRMHNYTLRALVIIKLACFTPSLLSADPGQLKGLAALSLVSPSRHPGFVVPARRGFAQPTVETLAGGYLIANKGAQDRYRRCNNGHRHLRRRQRYFLESIV